MTWTLQLILAIAFNLLLVSINLYLIYNIQQWRKFLYHSRNQLNNHERNLQYQGELLRQKLQTIPPTADHIVQQKIKMIALINQSKMLLNLLKTLNNLAKTFIYRQF